GEQAVAGVRAGGGTPARPHSGGAAAARGPGRPAGAPARRGRNAAPAPADTAEDAPVDASEPAPAATSDTESVEPRDADAAATSTSVAVDDVILAWATVLPELPVATRSAVQEAQPLSVDGDVVTFGVSPRLIEAARPRFRREADTIREALSRHVGASLRFNLVEHEGVSGEPSSSPSAPAPPPQEHDALALQ